ncbi:MAG TPA: hypothetical protein VHT02_04285 [Methylocella sp.]|nr:hypothetical protein [Methylocella sp.]
MTYEPPRLSLYPYGEDFVLFRVTAGGNTTEVILSASEVLTLIARVPALSQQVLSRFRPENTGTVRAVLVPDVAGVVLHQELLGEKMLLTLQLGTTGSSQATFAFSHDVAARLAEDIPPYLSKLRGSAPTKQ